VIAEKAVYSATGSEGILNSFQTVASSSARMVAMSLVATVVLNLAEKAALRAAALRVAELLAAVVSGAIHSHTEQEENSDQGSISCV
jgi:hypothetical protein